MPARTTVRPRGAAPRPRRDAAATRAAILAAARDHFARTGYDRAGVREIAASAGVTAALVNRYFGSKARLLAEVLAGGLQIESLLPDDRTRLGEAIAGYIAARGRRADHEVDPLLVLLRSATTPTADELLRARIDDQLVAPLAEWLGGEAAELRAALVISCMLGVSIVRRVLRSAAFRGAGEAELAALLGPVIQACIDPPPPDRAAPEPVRAHR